MSKRNKLLVPLYLIMKKDIFILFVLYIIGGFSRIFAEDYILKPVEGGNLFFITPFEIPSLNKGVVPLKVDITTLTFEDSVDWRTTLSIQHEICIDSMYIESEYGTIAVPVYRIYVEKEKKQWKYRFEFTTTRAQVHTLYKSDVPFVLSYRLQGKSVVDYAIKNKMWPKHKQRIGEMLYMMDLNP